MSDSENGIEMGEAADGRSSPSYIVTKIEPVSPVDDDESSISQQSSPSRRKKKVTKKKAAGETAESPRSQSPDNNDADDEVKQKSEQKEACMRCLQKEWTAMIGDERVCGDCLKKDVEERESVLMEKKKSKAVRQEMEFQGTMRRLKNRAAEQEEQGKKVNPVVWCITGFMVRCPCLVILLALLPGLVLSVIGMQSGFELQDPTSGAGFFVRNHPTANIRDAAREVAKITTYRSQAAIDADAAARQNRTILDRSEFAFSAVLLLDTVDGESGNVLTPARLDYMKTELFDKIVEMSDWEEHCVRLYTEYDNGTATFDGCIRPTSVLDFFYPEVRSLNLTDPEVTRLLSQFGGGGGGGGAFGGATASGGSMSMPTPAPAPVSTTMAATTAAAAGTTTTAAGGGRKRGVLSTDNSTTTTGTEGTTSSTVQDTTTSTAALTTTATTTQAGGGGQTTTTTSAQLQMTTTGGATQPPAVMLTGSCAVLGMTVELAKPLLDAMSISLPASLLPSLAQACCTHLLGLLQQDMTGSSLAMYFGGLTTCPGGAAPLDANQCPTCLVSEQTSGGGGGGSTGQPSPPPFTFEVPGFVRGSIENGKLNLVEYNGKGTQLVEPIPETLNRISTYKPSLFRIQSMVDKTFVEFSTSSYMTRILVGFGGPLPGFNSTEFDSDNQTEIHEEWAKQALLPVLERFQESSEDDVGLRLVFLGSGLVNTLEVIQRDAAFIGIALVFVGLYVLFHTRSVLLTLTGMFHVLLSFTFAFFFYKIVMGVQEFGFLNFLSIFIILGIGADDIFIVVDSWKQSRVVAGPNVTQSMHHRLAWAYRKSVTSMFATSLTTGAAFFANAVSLVPTIRLFGIFTGLLVVCNYYFVITFYPAVIVIYAKHFEGRGCCRCGPCCPARPPPSRRAAVKNGSADGATAKDVESALGSDGGGTGVSKGKRPQRFGGVPGLERGTIRQLRQKVYQGNHDAPDFDEEKELEELERIDEYRSLEQFFFKRWAPFIFQWRKYLVLLFLVLIGVGGFLASQLRPTDTPSRFLPDDNPIQRAADLSSAIGRTESVQQVIIAVGYGEIDRTGTDENDAQDVGTVVWTPDFKPGTFGAQQAIMSICEAARDVDGVRDREILCPMEYFKEWLESPSRNWTFPVETEALFAERIREFADEWRGQEAGASVASVGGGFGGGRLADYRTTLRFDDENSSVLRVIAIVANTTLDRREAAVTLTPRYDAWNSFVTAVNQNITDGDPGYEGATGLGTVIQYSANTKWVQMVTEQLLVANAIQGTIVSLALAFVVLLFTTLNLFVSLIAISAVMGVVATFLGTIVLLGWSVSIIESICITILVGLSVDYVVHLAIAYRESDEPTRFKRSRTALVEMGISVLSAAVTTFGSAVPLMLTTGIFFQRFGIFVALSILYSAIFAFIYFIAASMTFGPLRRQGDLTYCCFRRNPL